VQKLPNQDLTLLFPRTLKAPIRNNVSISKTFSFFSQSAHPNHLTRDSTSPFVVVVVVVVVVVIPLSLIGIRS
jgi:hypothetical protein